MPLSHERQEKTIELCQTLVRHPSNSGHEDKVMDALKNYMHDNHFDDVRVDGYGSIIGCIKGKYPGPKILFDGHIDTVPVPDPQSWKQKPYGAERINGKIYGRGTTDMKGPVAAMASAAVYFAQDTKRDFAGEIFVVGAVHEECFEGIASRAISQTVKPDLVVIGEPSELHLVIGQKGRAEIVFETFGVPAHSSMPHKGVNAVHLMCTLISELEKIAPPTDLVLGAGVCVLTDIISTPYPGASVVPTHCRATYDRRLLVGETPQGVLKPYQDVITQLEKTIPNFKAKVSYAYAEEGCYTGNTISCERFFPGWCAKPEDEYVQKALAELKAIGLEKEIAYYPFCTNGSHYAGEAGINTIGFGPSPGSLAHTIDEYIEEEQLINATEGYMAICKAFLQRN